MWEALTGFEKIFWIIAVPATGVFLLLSIMTLIGVSVDHAGFDFLHHDADAGGYTPLLTFRNLVVFLMIFGWTGIAMVREFNAGAMTTLAVSTLAGVAMMFVVMLMFYGLSKMTSSGNFKADDSLVGLEASVYLKIPAARTGSGKVVVLAGGRKREFRAQTHGGEIATNVTVKILEVHPDVLIVG